jgi:hypothetical protein
VLFCPRRKEGAERSGVATAGSDVSFIEQIGGARTEPSRRFEALRRFDSTQWLASSAAWRLDVISRGLALRPDPVVWDWKTQFAINVLFCEPEHCLCTHENWNRPCGRPDSKREVGHTFVCSLKCVLCRGTQ